MVVGGPSSGEVTTTGIAGSVGDQLDDLEEFGPGGFSSENAQADEGPFDDGTVDVDPNDSVTSPTEVLNVDATGYVVAAVVGLVGLVALVAGGD
jgi:hypothetical protein